tara:strand:+ start:8266 stop:8691 length:426 start_codon:yes stop_codon:yes gene_type:complete
MDLWIFKGTVLIVYFYLALAKMYPDWVDAVPIKICFSQKAGYPVIGLLLVQSWFQHVVALGGIIFDLLIGPALLWKRTRKAAFISSLVFHGFNSVVFQVGIFPFMGIAFGLFYFEPEVIQKLFFNQKGAFVARQEVVKAYF